MKRPVATNVVAAGACLALWGVAGVLGLRVLLAVAASATRPSHSFANYYTAALLLRQGADVSRFYDNAWYGAQVQAHVFGIFDIYAPHPPTTAFLLLPLALWSHATARVLWILAGLLCLAGAIGWLTRRIGLSGVWAPAFLVIVLGYQPLYANLRYGQVYTLVLGLLVMIWYGLRTRRDWALGSALGILLVFKAAALFVWLFLLVERRWRALGWGLASALTIIVISWPWLRSEAWLAYFASLADVSSIPERSLPVYQTQLGFIRRLTSVDPRWNPSPLVSAPLVAQWAPPLAALAMLAFTLWVAHRSSRESLAFAALIVANVVLSPISLDYHYVMLLLPIGILMRWAKDQSASWPSILLALGVAPIALDLPYQAPRLWSGVWALFAYPKLYGAWLLWGLAVTGMLIGTPEPTRSASEAPPSG